MKVDLYDTTLRDGMQGIEVSFTLADKIQIAKALDEIGIDYIEGGFPIPMKRKQPSLKRLKRKNLNTQRLQPSAPHVLQAETLLTILH